MSDWRTRLETCEFELDEQSLDELLKEFKAVQFWPVPPYIVEETPYPETPPKISAESENTTGPDCPEGAT